MISWSQPGQRYRLTARLPGTGRTSHSSAPHDSERVAPKPCSGRSELSDARGRCLRGVFRRGTATES